MFSNDCWPKRPVIEQNSEVAVGIVEMCLRKKMLSVKKCLEWVFICFFLLRIQWCTDILRQMTFFVHEKYGSSNDRCDQWVNLFEAVLLKFTERQTQRKQ